MAGKYTEITITAPDSAQEGTAIDIIVNVKNILDYTIYVIPVLDINGAIAEGNYETITPGAIRSWPFRFVMPSTDVALIASSWCESYYFDWQMDYSVEHTISVVGAVVGGIDLSSMIGLMMVVMVMGMVMKMMEESF